MKYQDSDDDDSSGDEFIKMTAAKAGLKIDSVLKSIDSATRPLAQQVPIAAGLSGSSSMRSTSVEDSSIIASDEDK